MVRYDLGFFLCCCKSFLGSTEGPDGEGDFYSLLNIERDATPEEIKRAYKRQSLQMHPDKLAQRGQKITEADQARFTRMKEAYEVLSDPHKRETYDALGEKGMKWVEEPFSLDPQELAHNFATSSVIDRSKIFAIFVAIAIGIFALPILICLKVDGVLGDSASWLGVLTPLWLWDAFILFYHSRVIMMGPIHRPDHIPEEEWVDPLPMSKRIFSLCRFLLVILFEILAALRLDHIIAWKWTAIFFPIFVWEATTLYKKLPVAQMKIVTVDDIEVALGKPFSEFTPAEKELIAKRYSVVPSTDSPEFEVAYKIKSKARQDCIKLAFRFLFLVFLVVQLDLGLDWSWWLIFTPFWMMSLCICCGSFQNLAEVQAAAAEKDPEFFGVGPQAGANKAKESADEENQNASSSNYGAMGEDGDVKASQQGKKEPISQEEREELRAQIMASGYKVMSSCCSQVFILIIVCLFVGKIQSPQAYASIWVIFPLLLVAGIILCCLGCTIFCIAEVPDGVEYDTGAAGTSGNPTQPPQGVGTSEGLQNNVYIPPAPMPDAASSGNTETTGATMSENASPKGTIDQEEGEVREGSESSPAVPTTAVPTTAAPTTAAPTTAASETQEAVTNKIDTYEATTTQQAPPQQPIDLLDDTPVPVPTAETKPVFNHQNSSIHELD